MSSRRTGSTSGPPAGAPGSAARKRRSYGPGKGQLDLAGGKRAKIDHASYADFELKEANRQPICRTFSRRRQQREEPGAGIKLNDEERKLNQVDSSVLAFRQKVRSRKSREAEEGPVEPVFQPLPLQDIGELEQVDLDRQVSIGLSNQFEEVDEYQNSVKQRSIVTKKYEGARFVGRIPSRETLAAQVDSCLGIIPRILRGEVTSPYYGSAARITKQSTSVVLTAREFRALDMAEFTTGFLGMKRQSFIAQQVQARYQDELQAAHSSNRTVQFWTLDSFVLYVLAPELAMHIVASDLGISKGEAYDLLYDTNDYGRFITDEQPFD